MTRTLLGLWYRCEVTANGFDFSIHVRPGASRDRVEGTFDGVLAVRVSAPASGGDANRAVRRLIARSFDVRPGSVEIIGGTRNRRKLVRVHGDHPRLAARHRELLTNES